MQENGNDLEPLNLQDSILVTNEDGEDDDEEEDGQRQQQDGYAVPAEDMNALEDSILVDNNMPSVNFDHSHILS